MSQIGRGMKSRGLFRANIFFLLLDLVDAPGIAPGSSALQTDADLSQLNVRKKLAGPNGLEPSSSSSTVKCIRLSATAPILGGTAGVEPAITSFTVRRFTN